MRAPKIAVATIAAPCAPSACHGVENGHAMRHPALMARPAPAPYSAPAIVGRAASEFRNTQLKNRTRIPPASVLQLGVSKLARGPANYSGCASEFRNTQLKNRTRIPPASVLPIPQAKPTIHGETRSRSLIHGGTGRGASRGNPSPVLQLGVSK